MRSWYHLSYHIVMSIFHNGRGLSWLLLPCYSNLCAHWTDRYSSDQLKYE
jgi:hypothetical protein